MYAKRLLVLGMADMLLYLGQNEEHLGYAHPPDPNAPSDPFCRARLVKRSVLEDTATFGVRQHFLPVIAAQRGHRLGEAAMRPMTGESAKDAPYVFKPLGHVRVLPPRVGDMAQQR